MSIEQATSTLYDIEWLFIFIFGAALGSFATVLDARVPDGLSIVRPPSKCPNCGHTLRWHENIPILGYLILGGKCAGCKQPISRKYPLIELSTAFLFMLSFTPGPDPKFGIGNFALAAMAVITVPLILIDLRLHRLPNALTYPTAVFLLALLLIGPFAGGSWQQSLNVLLQGLVPAASLLAIGLLSRGGMGLGDVKLAAIMGWSAGWFGLAATVTGFASAFLLGGAYAVIVLVTRKGSRKSAIPFGPFLLAGFWIAFAGGNLLQNVVLSLWHF
jgi:leader peptidase (prepilin peptidase)/N-methyltransferase